MTNVNARARRDETALRMILDEDHDGPGAPIDILDHDTLRIYVTSCLICNEVGVLKQDALLRAMKKRSLQKRVDRIVVRAHRRRASVNA